jgi:hypothetical protein
MKTIKGKSEGKHFQTELQVGLWIASNCEYLLPIEE